MKTKVNMADSQKNGFVYLCWRCGKHDIAETLSIVTGISKKDIISIKKQYNLII